MSYIKGRDVYLLVDGKAVAGSTSCTFNLTANTADASSKSDEGNGMWDNPSFVNASWNMSNESFITSVSELFSLLQTVIEGSAEVTVVFFCPTQGARYEGKAIITQLQVSAPNGDNATLSISLEGNGVLGLGKNYAYEEESLPPIKGKALMIAIQNSENAYATIAASTSHSLTVSVQTSEISCKDTNDAFVAREVTGKSVSISTEHLMYMASLPESMQYGSLQDALQRGQALKMCLGYYGNAVGAAVPDTDTVSWGNPSTLLISGDFLCTSLSINGPVKDSATYSAEFQSKGVINIG